MTETSTVPERSYGCTFGCGNPYDYVVISVADATTEFLCLPCYVRLAMEMVAAVTEPDDPKVIAAMEHMAASRATAAPGPAGKPRGRNAPATATDPDIFDAYEDVVTVDELPEEFR